SSRKQIRQSLNLRITECGLPHLSQRVYSLTLNFCSFCCLAIIDFLATISPPYNLLLKWHSELAEQFTSFFICIRSCDDDNIHASDFGYFIVVYLWEDQLLFYTECIVTASVKCFLRNTSEVSYAREGYRDQFIQELVHSFTTACNFRSDRHSFTQPECSDGFFSFCDYRFLTGDCFKFFNCSIQYFCILNCITNTHVHNNLLDFWCLHHRCIIEFINKFAFDLFIVTVFQTCHWMDLLPLTD